MMPGGGLRPQRILGTLPFFGGALKDTQRQDFSLGCRMAGVLCADGKMYGKREEVHGWVCMGIAACSPPVVGDMCGKGTGQLRLVASVP